MLTPARRLACTSSRAAGRLLKAVEHVGQGVSPVARPRPEARAQSTEVERRTGRTPRRRRILARRARLDDAAGSARVADCRGELEPRGLTFVGDVNGAAHAAIRQLNCHRGEIVGAGRPAALIADDAQRTAAQEAVSDGADEVAAVRRVSQDVRMSRCSTPDSRKAISPASFERP